MKKKEKINKPQMEDKTALTVWGRGQKENERERETCDDG